MSRLILLATALVLFTGCDAKNPDNCLKIGHYWDKWNINATGNGQFRKCARCGLAQATLIELVPIPAAPLEKK